MKLFCLPYAGGSAAVYLQWRKYQIPDLEIRPVELPGRGSRFNEKLCDSMDELVNILYKDIMKQVVEDEDFALYGHSMGSWVAYYLIQKILLEGKKIPCILFVSGKEAPQIIKSAELCYKMDNLTLSEHIYALGGTPKEVLQNEEMRELFLPIMRCDYQVIETCTFSYESKKIPCDIVVFNGKEDSLSSEDLEAWADLISGKWKLYEFPGNHFFIFDYTKELLEKVVQEIYCKE